MVAGSLLDLLLDQPIVVCIGPGGVGKTSTAAAIGVALAREGRRVCVLTIDPARRLASALGMNLESNEPEPVYAHGTQDRLYAVMLDAEATFDQMIGRYATSPEQADEIRTNPVYHNLVSRLSGTQEYMAFERLWELREGGAFDVVVVDTPPAQAAIDFIHAPTRLAGFLDNRIFKLLLKPPPFFLRPVAMAMRGVIRQVASVVGAQVVSDTVAFFQSFSGIEDGFRSRAQATSDLLASVETSYILVTSPQLDPLTTSLGIIEHLRPSGHEMSAVIVNRVLPNFEDCPRDARAPEELRRVVAELGVERRHQISMATTILGSASVTDWVSIPDIGVEVASVAALERIADEIASAHIAVHALSS
ncbi:MAG: ArsA family ATPase [Ferrimicrobium sp.]